ncbi:FCD domain-containing protein [Marispirochaeta aestuarii]|uniref:FadR/GntR family transcriptional regulator n=1 Tax=Marispirochaeta aestuarii TaxID=1963862 RepID=UPI002ABDB3E4|nr:FCD domain-containing protein [Marispirochaeta aestuarii]
MEEKSIIDLLSPRVKESAVDIVIRNIKRLLLTKELLPGDKLPNETQLANTLGVSRGSVREAMKIFHAFGIVEIKQGDGTYISRSLGKVLFDPLIFSLILLEPDIEELAEFRKIMEMDVVSLIIKNADDEDLEEIRKVYREMAAAVNSSDYDGLDLARYDLEFHAAMGRATGNRLIERTYSFILDFFAPSIEHTHENQQKGLQALDVHRKILDALSEKRIDKALAAIDNSMVVWKTLSK